MKLLTIDGGRTTRVGVLLGDQVLDVDSTAEFFGDDRQYPKSIKAAIAKGHSTVGLLTNLINKVNEATESQLASLRESGALNPYSETDLHAPIPNPGFILSVGMNYRDHLAEMNTPVPDVPASFTKHPSGVTGPGQPIILPASNGEMVDFEAEICFVFGRECYNVAEADAWNYVAGLTIANDVSARDWVAPIFEQDTTMGAIHAWEANVLGKQYPTFCPMGPVLATMDEIANPDDLRIETRLNGKVMQSSSSSQLVFSIPKLIAYFSKWYKFAPGDIVTTGSPAGVGYGRNPKVFMREGDVIEVEVEGVGTLSNPVSAIRNSQTYGH
jgi:2-keto-4-pentenoate hydratase/2-oxohepta-3-ene-1,7-dioic acid hydratase in catechol pathway